MGYITVTADVDIDYDDLDEDSLIDALQYKLERYAKKELKVKERVLKDAIIEMLNDDNQQEEVVFTDFPGSVTEELTVKVLKVLAKKYTLEQLETLANK